MPDQSSARDIRQAADPCTSRSVIRWDFETAAWWTIAVAALMRPHTDRLGHQPFDREAHSRMLAGDRGERILRRGF